VKGRGEGEGEGARVEMMYLSGPHDPHPEDQGEARSIPLISTMKGKIRRGGKGRL